MGAKGDNHQGSMGAVSAALIGVGGMVGGGIFAVLGEAVALAGGGTPVAFLLAGVVALLTCYSYVKLSCRYPEAGGTALFLDKAFGAGLFTGGLNLTLWLSYLVTIALYATAFASYGMTFFADPPGWLEHLLICLAILVPMAINLLNASLVSRSESYIVIGKLVLLGVVITGGMFQLDGSRLEPAAWKSPAALVVGGMVIFVAYEGFELIANAAGDVRDPDKNLPRAFFGCVALLGQAGFVIVSVSALMATFSAINATIYGNARLGYSLAVDGELPEELEKKAWDRPLPGVLATATISLLLANLVDLRSIAILGSGGFLLIFAAVCAAAFRLAAETGARRAVCVAGGVACLAALVALLAHTASDNLAALAIFGGLLAAAYGFEWLYPKFSGRPRRDATQKS
jgi:amino acid transporter